MVNQKEVAGDGAGEAGCDRWCEPWRLDRELGFYSKNQGNPFGFSEESTVSCYDLAAERETGCRRARVD